MMSKNKSLLKLLSMVATVAIVASSQAIDNRRAHATQFAIQQLMRESFGRVDTVLVTMNEKFFSFSEKRIEGRGYYSQGGWTGMRFDYSVKIKNDGSQAREASATLENGQKLSSFGEWSRPEGNYSYFIRLERPIAFENIRSNRVTLSGIVEGGDAQVEIFDNRDRRVHNSSVRGSNSRWSTTITLNPGSFRARVRHSRDSAQFDEVRFNVMTDNSDWGIPGWGGGNSGGNQGGNQGSNGSEAGVNVLYPYSGLIVTTSAFEIAGTSTAKKVRLEIFDTRNQNVLDSTVNVSSQRYKLRFNLPVGDYRMRASTSSPYDVDEFRFSVRPTGGGSGGGNDRPDRNGVNVQTPRANQNVTSNAFDLTGTSLAQEVQLEIFDSRNQRVFNSNVRVQNGSWRVQTKLGVGSYRLRAVSTFPSDSEEVKFTVMGGGSGGGTTPANENGVVIQSPRAGSVIGTSSFDVIGASWDSSVRIEIYDSRNKRVVNATVRVQNQNWKYSARLTAGEYRMVISSTNPSDSDEIRFSVRTRDPR